MWRCECQNCGMIKSVIASNLRNGFSRSCGWCKTFPAFRSADGIMKLTKDQLYYDIFDGEVTIHGIKMYLISEESIRVLEYPSHIERRRVTLISLSDNIIFFEFHKQLKKIIVPIDCILVGEYKLPDFVTVEYK